MNLRPARRPEDWLALQAAAALPSHPPESQAGPGCSAAERNRLQAMLAAAERTAMNLRPALLREDSRAALSGPWPAVHCPGRVVSRAELECSAAERNRLQARWAAAEQVAMSLRPAQLRAGSPAQRVRPAAAAPERYSVPVRTVAVHWHPAQADCYPAQADCYPAQAVAAQQEEEHSAAARHPS